MQTSAEIKTALVGNPNCGKSTIFNHLTGAKQKIGNFPGVTVERYEGVAQYEDHRLQFIDLPGVYSLSSYSDEEKVAAEYLNQEDPDIIINVLDASNLERNLYLTLILKELKKPMIVVLNMIDVAKRRGIEIDTEILSRELGGIPVLTSVGNQGRGMTELLAEIVRVALLPQSDAAKEEESAQPSEEEHCSSCSHSGCCGKCNSALMRQTAIDVARYRKINNICMRAVQSNIPFEKRGSDRIDSLLINKYLGIPIFLAALYVVFQLTFTIGQYPMDWIENGFALLSDAITQYWPADRLLFLKSLITDGIIGGVGGVLVFLPNILILFFALSLLEDSGYMARAALLCDRWMHKIGLHGRSIVPMLVGFGCTVPALMSTKMLSDRKERLTTLFILPLFSCGARFPIYALLIPAFFPPAWRGPVLWLIYLIGILIAIVVAKVMSIFFKGEEDTPFIIELPSYHFPTFRTVGMRTLERGWQYMKKAGTVILGFSIILWFLTNFPRLSTEEKAVFESQRTEAAESGLEGEELENRLAAIDNEESQLALMQSCAGNLGRLMGPVLRPMGFDWKIGTALVGAIAAKEVFVAQMGIVYAVGGDEEDEENAGLSQVLSRQYSPLTGFCIMLFCLIASPCMATFSMMAREAGSWKWAWAQWLFLTGIGWILTTLTYQIGSLFLK